MTGKDNHNERAVGLRREADEHTLENGITSTADLETMTPVQVRQMIHDLQMRRIELEIQNKELLQAQAESDAEKARYVDLAMIRKQAEDALQESHRQNQEILDSITDAFISLSDDMVVRFFNAAAEQILKKKRAEVIGRKLFDVFPEAKGSIFEKNYTHAIRTKKAMAFEVEFTVAPYQNWFDVRVYPGRHGITIYFQVITERKRAEEKKARLEFIKHQLQKTESLGRMAAAIAHHFNNKLHVVIGRLELVINGLLPGEPAKANVVAAMQAAEKAAEVSRMMLVYLGQVSDKREPMGLAEICRKSLSTIETTIPKKVALQTDIKLPGPAIIANVNQIKRIVINLITNAWEATGDGSGIIRLSVKTVSSTDITTVHRFPVNWQPLDSHYACLEVRDDGCGIADKDLEEVFSPFFSTKFTGRGLGLPVVLGLVQAHGGVATAESSPGKGSVFRVFFPLSTQGIAPQPHKKAPSLALKGSGTVLLVDDDRIILEVTGVMLSRLGFAVLKATDGIEAVEVFRRHRGEIRFVLSDVAMPRMNGWETLSALRQIDPGIPVILASGYTEEQIMEGAGTERPQAFLGKPYGFETLRDTVHRTLREMKK